MYRKLTKDQYQKIFNALPSCVTLYDRDLEIIWRNDAGRDAFGMAKTLNGPEPTDCPVQQTFQDGQVHAKDVLVRAKDGSTKDVLAQTSPLHADEGEIMAVIQTLVDVSELKAVRSQFILLGQTIAGMAHSIKNIMMGLDGGIYVVNKGIEANDREEIKEGWDIVLFNFEKISNIVQDILYCSKAREPDLQETDPNKIARDVYELFKDTAARYRIELRLDPDERLQQAVLDPAGLHTVLSNLVSNAMDACKVDFQKEEHVVEIKTRLGRHGETIIKIRDNGVGISEDLKEQVFEDLFSSKGDKGTGLGLMVTQKILNEHSGSIRFTSGVGWGTTFTVTFPKLQVPSD